MSDEIKEILGEIYNIQVRYSKPMLKRNYSDKDYIIESYENLVFRMKNYITNLQEENKRLKELNVCVGCNNNPDYKSRIDKAIEYIEKSMNNPHPFYEYLCGDENGEVENLDKLLNMLNGGDSDE